MTASSLSPWELDEDFQRSVLDRPHIALIVREAEEQLRREFKKDTTVYVYIEPKLTYDEIRAIKEYFRHFTIWNAPRRWYRARPYLAFYHAVGGGA